MAPMRISFIHSVIASSMLYIGSYPRFLAEQVRQQGDELHTNQGHAAARHELFHLKVKETAHGERRHDPYGLPLIPLLSR